MKKLISMFAVVAFVFAVGISFADVLVTQGYYKSGSMVIGPQDVDDQASCGLEGNDICTIDGHRAFDSAPDALGDTGSSSDTGLLKRTVNP